MMTYPDDKITLMKIKGTDVTTEVIKASELPEHEC